MSSINPNHLLVIMAALIFGAVVLFLLIFQPRKFKFNVNLDPCVAVRYGLGNLIGSKTVRFQITAFCLSHVINSDWERVIVDAIRAGHAPCAFDIFGGKVTCIIDTRFNDITTYIRPALIKRSQTDSALGSDLTFSETNIEIVGFPQKSNLAATNPVCDVGIEKRGDNT